MKWYETNYVNHRDWILDNLNLLSLNAKEAIVGSLTPLCKDIFHISA